MDLDVVGRIHVQGDRADRLDVVLCQRGVQLNLLVSEQAELKIRLTMVKAQPDCDIAPFPSERVLIIRAERIPVLVTGLELRHFSGQHLADFTGIDQVVIAFVAVVVAVRCAAGTTGRGVGGVVVAGPATTRELVVDRVMALESEAIDLEQLKWVVLMVLFNQPGQETMFSWMEDFVFDREACRLH